MQNIIALTGAAGSGKDTAADYLVQHHGYTKIAFADAVRSEVCHAFGVPVDLLLDRATKETPSKALCLSRCNDHRFVGIVLAAEINDEESSSEAVEATMRQPRSPRRIMQLWGTEYRRTVFADDYWLVELDTRISQITGHIVITDCRFDNEAQWLSRQGAEIWTIHRSAAAAVSNHTSEQPIARYWTDRDLDNNSDIYTLQKQIEHNLAMMARAKRGAA